MPNVILCKAQNELKRQRHEIITAYPPPEKPVSSNAKGRQRAFGVPSATIRITDKLNPNLPHGTRCGAIDEDYLRDVA